mmetsp:Transcript_32933/g.59022  ORF Transcript_32933/g.59022 Transcript_32933/m.59022 type:complete len:96 (-) Transcript_32933:102-389(-)
MKITPCCEKLDAGANATRHLMKNLSPDFFRSNGWSSTLQLISNRVTVQMSAQSPAAASRVISSVAQVFMLCSLETLSLVLYVALLFQDIYFDLTK